MAGRGRGDGVMLNHAHQIHLFNPAFARPIIQIGVGAVGSYAVLLAAKAGVKEITVIDGDMVQSHNLPMSAYWPEHIGMYKVDALEHLVKVQTGVSIQKVRSMYEQGPLQHATVLSSVDTMNTGRSIIWPQVRMNPTVDLYCDTRTNGHFVEVYTVEPMRRKDIEKYEATLFDDSSATPQNCGMHGIITASSIVAASMLSNVFHYWEHGTKAWRFAERCDILQRADFDLTEFKERFS
jgi:hypothetical protein